MAWTGSIYMIKARSLRLFGGQIFSPTMDTNEEAGIEIRKRRCLPLGCGVPTYIYETTDPKKPIRNFEVKQSVHDEPLRNDPETGEAARRVISAGYGEEKTEVRRKN